MSYRQHEKSDNVDYLNNLLTLIKVYEQYCGLNGVNNLLTKKINVEVAAAFHEQGNALGDNDKQALMQELTRDARQHVIAIQLI